MLGRDKGSTAGSERTLRSFIAYCQDTLLAPQLAPSPVALALVDAEKRRAMGLAPAVTSALDSTRAAHGSLKAFMDWCATAATVAADVERALADVQEEERASLSTVAELGMGRAEAEQQQQQQQQRPAGDGSLLEAAAALAATPSASAAALQAYGRELHELHCCLLALLQASLDTAAGALLECAEDYSGEAKGLKELIYVDTFGVDAALAAASPAAVLAAAGPFSRPRAGGEMIIWCSMTGQRVSRNPKPFSGPSLEVEFQKGCLGTAVNVAVRVIALCTALEVVPGLLGVKGGEAGAGAAAKGKQQGRPRSAATAPLVGGGGGAAAAAAAAVAAAVTGLAEEGKEGAEAEGKEGKEADEGSAAAAAAAVAAAAAAAAASKAAAAAASALAIPLRPLGGWICLDQLLMSAPNSGIRGWAMTSTTATGAGGSGGAGSAAAAVRAPALSRMEHPAASNPSAASTTSIKVKWRVPDHIVLGPLEHVCPSSASASASPSRALLPGRWSAERQQWGLEGVADPTFNPATRTVQFSATAFTPHALLQPRAADFPYTHWRLAPAPPAAAAAAAAAGEGQHAACLSLTTARGLAVRVHVSAAGCRLLGPVCPELAHLLQGAEQSQALPGSGSGSGSTSSGRAAGAASSGSPPCLPPGQLLAALRASGLNLTPLDSDSAGAAALLAGEGSSRVLAPLLPPGVEAALHADLALACAAFQLQGVAGRGFVAGQPPSDPSDAPPNAEAAVLAQVLALEVLEVGEGEGAGGGWRAEATATVRVRVLEDRGLFRGFKLVGGPEGGEAGSSGSATLEACLAGSAAPEASVWMASAPATFTENVRRLLCLVRPLSFSA